MKIYTKTGDKGKTSLFGGQRVLKSHHRVEAYGSVDELNSFIGLLRDSIDDEHVRFFLFDIQNDLFVIGSHLATPPEKENLKSGKHRLSIRDIEEKDIVKMEHEIDVMNEQLQPMTHFILPGGAIPVSYCHVARTVCRRAERICVKLNEESTIKQLFITYLNRLSDYLFVLARKLAKDNSVNEIIWNE